MTGFMPLGADRTSQRLTKAENAEKGRLDSFPFSPGSHKTSDSVSRRTVGAVFGRQATHGHTTMDTVCTHTVEFVCVCAHGRKGYHGAALSETESPHGTGVARTETRCNHHRVRRSTTTTTTYYTQLTHTHTTLCVYCVCSLGLCGGAS